MTPTGTQGRGGGPGTVTPTLSAAPAPSMPANHVPHGNPPTTSHLGFLGLQPAGWGSSINARAPSVHPGA